MKRKIKWCLLVGWMIVIFLFSHQTGQQSSESSGLIEKLFSILPFLPNQIFGVALDCLIRKAAQFSESWVFSDMPVLMSGINCLFPDEWGRLKMSALILQVGRSLWG